MNTKVINKYLEWGATKNITNAQKSGLLQLDAKATLAFEIALVLDRVISPKTVKNFNYVYGLPPERLASIVKRVFSEKASEGQNAYFYDNAYSIWYYGLVFHSVLIKFNLAKKSPAAHFETIRQFTLTTPPFLDLFEKSPEIAALQKEDSALGAIFNDGLNYLSQLQGMDSKDKTGITSTAFTWINKFLQSEDLRLWANSETSDIDVADVLYGAKFGVSLPETLYGDTGLAIQQLIKAKFYSDIKIRGNNPLEQNKGYARVFLIVDEAQDFLDKEDMRMISQARSFELVMIFAMQSYDGVYARFDQHTADKFLNDFRSFLSFESSHLTYEKIRQRIGKARVIQRNNSNSMFDFLTTTALQLATPYFDLSNPYRKYIKKITWQGVISRMFKANPASTRATWAERAFSFLGTKFSNGGGNNKNSIYGDHDVNINTGVTLHMSKEPEDIFSSAEIQKLQRFYAIAGVQRGGFWRRDIIKTIPYSDDFTEIDTSTESAEKILEAAEQRHRSLQS